MTLLRFVNGLRRRARQLRPRLITIGIFGLIRNHLEVRRAGPGIRKLQLRDGYQIRCRTGTTDTQVFYETFANECQLPPERTTPATILDLGSNIGTTIIHYARLYPGARILGVELDEENYELCRLNISALGERCSVLNGAAWWESGVVRYDGREAWGLSVQPEGLRQAKAYTISDLIERLGGSVDFVKMDIEGAEAPILKRAETWIHRVKCLNIEVHPPYTVNECVSDLSQFGLECSIDSNHWAFVIAKSK